jgi:uncharacterized protein (TIGR02284 family)
MSAEMTDYTITVIEKLIETCRDGQAGFLEAAEHTGNSELKAFFSRQSLQRSKFAAELESVARNLGWTDSERSASVAGKLHRAWIELRHKLGGGDARVLAAVENGEHNARNNYQEALHAGLPADVQSIIERQAESVFAAHELVRTLQDVYKSAA